MNLITLPVIACINDMIQDVDAHIISSRDCDRDVQATMFLSPQTVERIQSRDGAFTTSPTRAVDSLATCGRWQLEYTDLLQTTLVKSLNHVVTALKVHMLRSSTMDHMLATALQATVHSCFTAWHQPFMSDETCMNFGGLEWAWRPRVIWGWSYFKLIKHGCALMPRLARCWRRCRNRCQRQCVEEHCSVLLVVIFI